MQKYLILLPFLFSALFATPFNDDIVDEAKTISIVGSGETSSSNPTRTVIFSNGKVNVYQDKLILSSIQKEFIISITDAFHLPNTLIIKRGDKVIHQSTSKVAKDIAFNIAKTKLQIGDKVVVKTSEDVVIVDMNVTK
jgi:hypothetical protein